ncbi:peptidoglycan editing factor PgeF [Phytoactinopolyspora alkaliphila]|uniref:Purine nucleoside phosphorylase n=1 Tax=Phytoactinopolyspora alkaliphila TaxID=1783498 RepID=A0A6N9YFN9_9ACTN|nr:peptidoglycan editing factor PgeF [Phytoactinopolyspora alkaliphila]
MIASRRALGGINFAFTDRVGGVSPPPFGQLNLAHHVGDEPAAVERNRHVVARGLGLSPGDVVYMNQVHGADVAVVDGPRSGNQSALPVDAMVTARPGLALAVMVADCVPVLVADPEAGLVGVAHAGRPGLAAGIVPAVVGALRALGARTVVASVGPAVCGACYEVPEAMRADVAAVVPEAWASTRAGTPALDLPRGVAAQLDALGVEVINEGRCTLESGDLYSYRRDRTTGRFAGLAWITA